MYCNERFYVIKGFIRSKGLHGLCWPVPCVSVCVYVHACGRNRCACVTRCDTCGKPWPCIGRIGAWPPHRIDVWSAPPLSACLISITIGLFSRGNGSHCLTRPFNNAAKRPRYARDWMIVCASSRGMCAGEPEESTWIPSPDDLLRYTKPSSRRWISRVGSAE